MPYRQEVIVLISRISTNNWRADSFNKNNSDPGKNIIKATLTWMGFFWAPHRWGKGTFSWFSPSALLIVAFFHRNLSTFITSRNWDTDRISIHNFQFFLIFFLWAFKCYFNKHGYNFDDVSKIAFSRVS